MIGRFAFETSLKKGKLLISPEAILHLCKSSFFNKLKLSKSKADDKNSIFN